MKFQFRLNCCGILKKVAEFLTELLYDTSPQNQTNAGKVFYTLEDESNQILKRWEPEALAPTLQSGLRSIDFIHYSEFLRWEPEALAPTQEFFF